MSTTENNAALIERDYGVVDGRVTTNRILVDEPKPVTAWHPLLRPPPSPVTSATLFSLSLSFFFLRGREAKFNYNITRPIPNIPRKALSSFLRTRHVLIDPA